MSFMRESKRTRLARASARASGAPTQVWIPKPKPRCRRPSARSRRNSLGSLELARVAVRGAVVHHHVRARRDVDGADLRGDARQPELTLDRGLEAERLLDEARDAGRARRAVVAGGRRRSPISCIAEPRSRAVVSPPAENRLAAISATSCTSGTDPSGKVAVARPVITSERGARRHSSMYAVNRS